MTYAPLTIQNAQVLLPSGELAPRDVAIAAGKITAVGTSLEISANTQTVNGNGLTLLPGVIDPHVHFRKPELDHTALDHTEDFLIETCAGAKGGVTSFLEMPNTMAHTTTQTDLTDLTDRLAIATAKSLINYGCFVRATSDRLGSLRQAESTCGIKIFIGTPHEPHSVQSVETSEAIETIFEAGDCLIAAQVGQQHETELTLTKMALRLAKKYQRRLHLLQLSTGGEAELLRRDKPSWVTAEVTPQHLLLDMSAYESMEALAPMEPPLRSMRDRDILWQALLDGVIDFIATGHASQPLVEKEQDHANAALGMPGIETGLPLMLTQAKENRCTIAQVSHWMSTAVAQAYQIPQKGLIEPGYDADLVLVDLSTYRPVRREELKTECGWSPFEGWKLTGWPVMTLVGGQIVYDRGTINTAVRGKALQFGS